MFLMISFYFALSSIELEHHGVMVKMLQYGIVESEFELQSSYYIHFQTNTLKKGMNLLILLTMSLIVPLLFLKYGFGVK